MQIALMIPMTHAAAQLAHTWEPDEWQGDEAYASRIDWPEQSEGIPLLQETIASALQESIERDVAHGYERMVIVTRSDVAFYRVRLMIAQGAPITAAVYLVDDDGQERLDVGDDGMMPVWPRRLFGHVASECSALLRVRDNSRRKAHPATST